MIRTTLTLDDRVFAAIRRKAADEGRSFKDVVNDLLREALRPKKSSGYKFVWKPFRGKGLQPGVNLEDRDALFDLMDQDNPRRRY